jgi:hypothetical protein
MFTKLAPLLALLAACACSESHDRSCTIGLLQCTDSSGQITQNGNAQLRRCEGPEGGGDANGEVVVVEDCAMDDLACYVEFRGNLPQAGGCISRECADSGFANCIELGSTSCFGASVKVCSMLDGCQRYADDEACASAGGECVENIELDEGICEVP